jgi:hypothetical protein
MVSPDTDRGGSAGVVARAADASPDTPADAVATGPEPFRRVVVVAVDARAVIAGFGVVARARGFGDVESGSAAARPFAAASARARWLSSPPARLLRSAMSPSDARQWSGEPPRS